MSDDKDLKLKSEARIVMLVHGLLVTLVQDE